MASNRVDRFGCNITYVGPAPVVEEVAGTVNKFITTIAEGDKRTVTRTYKKGAKHYRYNDKRQLAETIFVENDCIVDVVEKWDRSENYWATDEVLWETARDIPPPPPKPPGFWAKLWAKLTRKAALPTARLLKD